MFYLFIFKVINGIYNYVMFFVYDMENNISVVLKNYIKSK